YFQYTDHYLLNSTEYQYFLDHYDDTAGVQISRTISKTSERVVNDLIDIDLEINRSQIEKALLLLVEDSKVFEERKTADIQIETNSPNHIFLITRPTQGNRNKVLDILSRVNDEVIILNNLEICNRTTQPIKYKTDFPSCYIQISNRGYKNGGKRWIDKD